MRFIRALLPFAFASASWAATVTYTDLTSWQMRVGGYHLIDFEAPPENGSQPGIQYQGVVFQSWWTLISMNSGCTDLSCGLSIVYREPDPWGVPGMPGLWLNSSTVLRITFPYPVNAIAGNLLQVSNYWQEYPSVDPLFFYTPTPVQLSNGNQMDLVTGANSPETFFGLTFDEPITSVVFVGYPHSALDNLAYSNEAPEPTTMTLLASAIIGLGLIGKRFTRT